MKISTLLAVALAAAPVLGAPILRNPLPIRIPAGGSYGIQSGDFNGDHHKDVLLPIAEGKLVVYLGNGTGPFAEPVITETSFPIHPAVAVSDVNGDGRSDVAIAQHSEQKIQVALANADGSFAVGMAATLSRSPTVLTAGDFNGDGHADLVVGAGYPSQNDTELEVLSGNGAGQFSAGSRSIFDDSFGQLLPADVNGDGKLDIVASYFGGSVTLINAGNGTFTRTGSASGGTALAHDFDGDGKLDLAIAASGSHDQYLAVHRGNGDGTYAAAVRYAVGYDASSIEAADVDGDGHLDLLLAANGCHAVSVLRGAGNGTFGEMELFISGPGAWRLVAADFDRDGDIDVVTHDYNAQVPALSFLRGNGDGTFATYRSVHTNPNVPVRSPGRRLTGGVVADMNNDQKPDVVGMQTMSGSYLGEIAVLLNDGAGALGNPVITPTTAFGFPSVPQFAVGDVDHDGNEDVVMVPSGGQPMTYRGLGTGAFGTPVPFNLAVSGGLFLGHFDADTHLDLFLAGGHYAYFHPGNGDGTFGAGVSTGIQAYDPLFGDVNGDGRMDYVSRSARSTVLALNDGAGHFTRMDVTSEEISAATLADFNGDAKVDILLTTYTGTDMRFGNGDGTFGPPVTFRIAPVPNYPSGGPVATADFDGDGVIDVAFGTSIYLSNGDGTFRSRSRFRTYSASVEAADMDGNGSPDLVITSNEGDDVTILATRTGADPTKTSTLTLTDDSGGATQYARSVTFTAKVEGDSLLALGGVVRFSINGEDVALIAVDYDGVAKYTAAFPVGAYQMTATYTGDEYHLTSTDTGSFSVTKAVVQLLIEGFPNPAPKGQTVYIHVTRNAPSAFGLPGPSGELALRDGDTPLNLDFRDGLAQTRALTIGTHVISVDYAGDDNYLPATASYTQEITKPVPILAIQLPAAPVMAGATVELRAYFVSASPAPSGTITFYGGDVLLGTRPLNQGSATLQTSFTWGFNSVRAEYAGDAVWDAAVSANYGFNVYAGPWGTTPIVYAAGSDGRVQVYWSHIVGGHTYKLWRKPALASAWELAGTYTASTLGTSGPLPAGTTWLYAVTAVDANGNVSPMSAPDLATAVTFTDGLTPRSTVVKALHVTQLRSAIGAVRTFSGLSPFPYTNAVQAGGVIRRADLAELRTALAQARSVIGLPAIAFTDSPPTTIKALHFLELRAGVD